ncbi:hypothetical protein VTJ83DRAFT_7310 [Remersonia thermophila]|uniref:BZIP domain-containing protein n=1 Tax=Remersonia thermophila TaxID=72144 RepID=A0ABR4D393_9PEZI
MTSTRHPLGDFILTPQQQSLLFAALNANRQNNVPSNTGFQASPLQPLQFDTSPIQGSGSLSSFHTSPDLDFSYDFTGPDSSFDFPDGADQPKMIGDLPGAGKSNSANSANTARSKSDSADAEASEKRSYPEDAESSEPKRRESEEKVPKKPGRKPLTTEPSSKRKAQNRAAQRAFRERKEKHLRDLENKVQELEKISKAATTENEELRAQIDKMTIELNEYKKRLSLLSTSRPVHPGPAMPFGSAFVNNLNDVNFQFEFPRFDKLPGPPIDDAKKPQPASSQTAEPTSVDHQSPSRGLQDGVSPRQSANVNLASPSSQTQPDLTHLSMGLYTPPLTGGRATNGSSGSVDSQYNASAAISTSSPSASSNSHMGGTNSSCGTSPEPLTQSPLGFKPVDTLGTIGEEGPSLSNPTQGLGHFADPTLTDFSQWLPSTDFQFDPQVFGDYRDPQDNSFTYGFDDGLFNNDLVDADFFTPYNLPPSSPAAQPKQDLISQIDAAKEADEGECGKTLLKTHDVWERLQNCPKAQSGEFDLDALCADLQKKAKCDGTGPVISEKDFCQVIKKHLCKDEQTANKVDAMAKKFEEQKTPKQQQQQKTPTQTQS